MLRRHFVQLAAAGLATASIPTARTTALSREPIERSGPPRFQIGLAAYSFRNYFSYMKGKAKQPASDGPAMDMLGFLGYCVSQGADAAELTSYFFKPDPDQAYLLNLKHEAFIRGMTVSGTAIGNNFTIGRGLKLDREIQQAMTWIDRAATLGAPHIRFFAGTGKELKSDPRRLDEAVEALSKCATYAGEKGIFLGVENHGNLTAEQMLQIMDRVDSRWVGINLDTGNFWSQDPYRDLQQCVPYAVNVQVKVDMKTPDRKNYPADFGRIGQILKDAGYQGFVILEYEAEDPYKKIPAALEKLRAALA